MSEFQKLPIQTGYPKPGGTRLARSLEALGEKTLSLVPRLVEFISLIVAVLWQSLRPLTWRRSVRAEFLYQCHHTGTRALPFIGVAGVFIGLAMVYQALYWLRIFGQSELVGNILVLVLVREISPLIVSLIVIGRSGPVILARLGMMQAEGQVHMLDAQGIDPFVYLLIPRVLAISVCTFCLTVAFTVVALAAGFVAGNTLQTTGMTVYDFIASILMAMGPEDYAIIPLKTLSIGFVVGLIVCTTGLSGTGNVTDVPVLLPGGIMKSVLAVLLLSGFWTLILL
ncbi:MAG: ABC transporter permease [Desulfobacterales bacterium]|jgi:phospholipid/cholesterol/gamma-HCH transport system permease protein